MCNPWATANSSNGGMVASHESHTGPSSARVKCQQRKPDIIVKASFLHLLQQHRPRCGEKAAPKLNTEY